MKKGFLLWLGFFAALFFQGCAGIQSGHYIRLHSGESSASLSRQFFVSEEKIKRYNPGVSFRSGEIIFIPLERGILSQDVKAIYAHSSQRGLFGDLLWPVPSSKKISSGFGRRWNKNHNGVDISAKRGSTIVAAEKGQVIYSGKKLSSFGNMIVIRHSAEMYTLYAHNRVNYVRKGQWVRRGYPIGEVGNSGRSTGYHLHFEVRKKDYPLNPLAFFIRGKSKLALK